MAISIIVADDHKLFREGISNLLENEADFKILAQAKNGLEAERLARSLKPDVMVMDISMPEQNGILATERILASNPRIKTIILSMHSHHRYIQDSFRAGAMSFLLKDCAFEELCRAIHTVMNNQCYLSAEISKPVIDGFIGRNNYGNRPTDQSLSLREKEVLQVLAEGKSTREISELLHISIKTVETHRSNIMKKLQARNLAELVKYAIREGLTQL